MQNKIRSQEHRLADLQHRLRVPKERRGRRASRALTILGGLPHAGRGCW